MLLSQGRILLSVVLFCAFFPVLTAFAQDLDDVSIRGRVVDSNRLPVAGASLKAAMVESGYERTAATDSSGAYRFIDLPPGIYTLTVQMSGFATIERPPIHTISGQNLTLDFELAPAGVRAQTTVNADDGEIAIDTTRTVVASTLSEREIEEIPNNARNPLDLVLTLGGASEEALSTMDLAEDRNANPRSTPFEQGNFSLSGGASFSNNITIDGLDNNDDRSARDRFQPSLESVVEVQVVRNQFSAEYGRASGGRVNLRTRSGSNRLRGRAFMFFRDDGLNANTWFNNSRGISRLPLRSYNPGFTLSGPVELPFYNGRNRTFFSISYEYNRLNDSTLIDTFLPVVQNPNFALPPPTGSEQFCDSTNAANCPASAGFISPFSAVVSTPNTTHTINTRIDHKLFNGNDITFGHQFGRKKNRRTRTASTTRIEDALQARNSDTDAFNITDNQVFGNKAVNQVRFQWSRFKPSFQTENPLDSVVLIGYRSPLTNGTQTLIAGNSTASSLQDFADTRNETRYQIQESLTVAAGRHTLKIGGDLQDVDSKATALGDATGTFNFANVQNFSNNVLSRFRQNFGTATDVTNTYWGIFLNDEINIRRGLTLTLGLRYERETAVSDDDNFGPRIGLAWDPVGDGKSVIRMGAGIFYNRVLLRTVGDFIQNGLGGIEAFDSNSIPTSTGTGTLNPRQNILASIAAQFPNGFSSSNDLRAAVASADCGPTASPVPCSSQFGFLANTGSGGNPLRSVDPNLKIPESYQINVGYERKIGRNWVIEANYTWNKTAHLWREFNTNLPVLPSGFADYTEYLIANPFTFTNVNGTTRTYKFYLGPTDDPSGVSTNPATQSGNCGTTVNVTCWVNLNTVNSSTTSPNSNAGNGISSNSVGGPIGIAREALRALRPDPSVDEKERVASIGNSRYQGLVVEMRRRLRSLGGGFAASLRAVYTLSELKDDGLNNTSNAEINGDFSREWARALQDRRHRFVFSGTVDTPNWLGKLRFSPIFRFGSSAPFNLGIGIDRNLNDTSTDRVNFSGDISEIKWRRPGSPVPLELLSQFSLQPIGSSGGNLPRNSGRGPRMYIFDLNITREWKFGERFRLRPNIEIGNLFNLAVFSYGAEFIDFTGLSSSPTATQLANFNNTFIPTRTLRPRDIRIGVRFDF